MRRILTSLLLACFASTGICTAKDNGGFLEPREKVFEKFRRVGLLPLELPAELGGRDAESAYVERELTTQLAAMGFTAVGPEFYRSTFAEMNRQEGGIYDTRTGELDRKKYDAIYQRATHAFAQAEKLDGFVVLRVRHTTAEFAGASATWDGVTDRSTGTPQSTNAFKDFMSSGGSGTLSALSLVVMLQDLDHKPWFVGKGGIQLSVYYGPHERGTGFKYVEPDSLLRDLPRLSRAIKVVTDNISKTQKQRKAEAEAEKARRRAGSRSVNESVLPPLPPGRAREPDNPFKVSRDEILSRIRKVAIMPLELQFEERVDEISARYVEEISLALGRLGVQTIDAAKLHEAWQTELSKSIGFYDPYTGRFDTERASAARLAATRQASADAILWPRIVPRAAEQKLAIASWDGVSQRAMYVGEVEQSFLQGSRNLYAGEGMIEALSVELTIRSTDDTELYRAFGGIQVTQRIPAFPGGISSYIPLAPKYILNDVARDRQAVYVALRPLLLTPEELHMELNPEPKVKQSPGRRP